MTLELLEARKKELQIQQQQSVANVNAINGALQDIEYWISQLKAAEVPPAPAV